MLVSAIAQRMSQLQVNEHQFDARHLRTLCLRQQEDVMKQMIKASGYDIYQEIARVCPSQADLRLISNEQLSARLSTMGQLPVDSITSSAKISEECQNQPQSEAREPNLEFCPFSQPSIRNFLEDLQESTSLWNNLNDMQ